MDSVRGSGIAVDFRRIITFDSCLHELSAYFLDVSRVFAFMFSRPMGETKHDETAENEGEWAKHAMREGLK
jgi:activator of HSP90 ATPase